MTTTTVSTTQSVEERQQALIEQIVAILKTDLGLKNYEGADLAADLAKPNFSEFWFPGNRGGSLKVFVNRGVPFVFDQYRVKVLKTQIEETNAKIKALFV